MEKSKSWFSSNRIEDKKLLLEERKLKELVEGMLNSPKVQKLISPNTDEYFLIDEAKQMSLCLEHSKVQVANHEYLLIIPTRLSFCEDLKKLVKDSVEVERQTLKKQLFQNQIELLDKLNVNYKSEE